MDLQTGDTNDRDVRINLAIYDYHAAIERGEAIDRGEWLARHAEIAGELNAYFEDLAALELVGRTESVPNVGSATALVPEDGDGAAATASKDVFRPGDALGDYVLLEQIGEGGQGVVWKARPRSSPEIVLAIKTLRGPVKGDTRAVQRLRQDVEAIARMKHENIIQTYFVGEDSGHWFFVMEFVEGGTLEGRLELYKAEPRAAALLIEKTARAVHHAHTRNPGVLHLDLKPGNLLLTSSGEPKVTDFGLSMQFTKPEPQTHGENGGEVMEDESGGRAIVGTIPFMSPEMAEGHWADVSTGSDIYGLGAVFFAMLTGRAPFRGANAAETLALVSAGKAASPRTVNRKVDRELAAVCMKCLERNPKQRYGSADALANDVRRWLEKRPTLAGGRPSVAREFRFWVRRHPLRFGLVLAVAFGIWIARIAVSLASLEAENARGAERLAHDVYRELRLVYHATRILANDPRLRAAFDQMPGREQVGRRRAAIEAFLHTSVEKEDLFGIAGGNPLVNVFVLDPAGVLIADTAPDSRSVGKSYRVRDYYTGLFERDWPRDHVYLARSFLSVKDNQYKIAVSTRAWGEHGELLGALVANFTIGPRLIDFDLRQEPTDAAVLCPIDDSDPTEGNDQRIATWRYIAVLDRRYRAAGIDRPFVVDSAECGRFARDLNLESYATGPRGGELVDYHRVGETHMLIVVKRPCPWPLSLGRAVRQVISANGKP